MSDLRALVSIKEIVKETLWFAGKGESEYKKFLQYAINGFRELNKHHYNNAKQAKLQMDSNFIIPYPMDMVKDVAIYVPVNGEFKRLTNKNSLVNTVSLQSGVEVRNTDDGENASILTRTTGYQPGIHNTYGYYTADNRNKRFIFVTNYRTEVILSYISNGISSDNDEVSTIVKEALQAYIMWQNAYYDRSYNGMEKQMYFNAWDTAFRMLRNIQAQTLDELADDILNMSTLLPQR